MGSKFAYTYLVGTMGSTTVCTNAYLVGTVRSNVAFSYLVGIMESKTACTYLMGTM